ncbi:hypothetical protein LSAT2_027410, partial [Lamellibrachia satsuma]
IARQLGDQALEAQACYSLGNTYTLLRDYERAIDYHVQHLQIAKALQDRVGEGRACWSLGNAHTALGNHENARQFAVQHLEISKEIGDETGHVTARMNLADLNNILGLSSSNSSDDTVNALTEQQSRMRRRSMENLELVKITPDKKDTKSESVKLANSKMKLQKAASIATDLPRCMQTGKAGSQKVLLDDDNFFDLLSRYQSRRIDDQRCSFRLTGGANSCSSEANKENAEPEIADDFFDMIAGIQGSRMNDQRANLSDFPGLQDSEVVMAPFIAEHMIVNHTSLDDQFFEMLMKCQSSRLEDQRSSLPKVVAPTVPDEDFFNLIQRVQSNRLDEQRSCMPTLTVATPVIAATNTTNSSSSKKRRADLHKVKGK